MRENGTLNLTALFEIVVGRRTPPAAGRAEWQAAEVTVSGVESGGDWSLVGDVTGNQFADVLQRVRGQAVTHTNSPTRASETGRLRNTVHLPFTEGWDEPVVTRESARSRRSGESQRI